MLRADRTAARQASDPNAELCWLATVADGEPRVRAVVLRDLGDALAVFVNGSSAKCRELAAQPRCELALWLPSSQRQWRLRGTLQPCAADMMRRHWPKRPRISKVLDHVYEAELPQGSPLPDRATLQQAVSRMDGQLVEDPAPPAGARAFQLLPDHVEQLILHAPPELHERTAFQLTAAGQWQLELRVP